MIRALLSLLLIPSTLDSIARFLLVGAARFISSDDGGVAVARWLVVVPARHEGEAVTTTLESIAAARNAAETTTILLLDGADQDAAAAAAHFGAETRVKDVPGPSKGAALAWYAVHHKEEILAAEAVLILDVGSELSANFLRDFRWPAGADGAQAFIRGRGAGVGQGVSASEVLAQGSEDAGRQRVGWPVRLRGTGTVLRPAAFLSVMPRLLTQVEDEEATLLLAAQGARLVMAGGAVFISDEKPTRRRDAAVQRARWLAGRFEILLRQGGALAALIARNPAEGSVFLLDIFGRPVSLTAPLRFLVGAILIAVSLSPLRVGVLLCSGAAIITAIVDVLLIRNAGASFGAALQLVVSWAAALFLAPRALVTWMRARRR